MKKGLFVFGFLFISSFGFAQCPAGPIELNSQADVDNFVLDYPGCTEILDDLIIDGNDIINFKGMSGITSVGRNLRVRNTQVINFQGFEFLETVGRELDIFNNNNLIDLRGLESLTSVLRFFVFQNSSIETLEGIDSLTSLLESESVFIANNDSLISIDGLETVTNCPECFIYIGFNDNLTNLFGLQNIPAEDISFLFIEDNPSLVVCNLTNICQFLADGGEHLIEDNAPGCSSGTEVLENCLFSVSEEDLADNLSLSPNPVSEILLVSASDTITIQNIKIFTTTGLEALSVSEKSAGSTRDYNQIDLSGLAAGIYLLKATTTQGTLTRKIVKE